MKKRNDKLADKITRYLKQEKEMGREGYISERQGCVSLQTGDVLGGIYSRYKDCRACGLSGSRRNFVFGEGEPGAVLMFIGEGPGFQEDLQGKPFVGKAGQLLTKIIESIGLRRETVYITNIVKCHPMVDPSNPDKRGNDRPPTKEEMNACFPILLEQINAVKPEIICALGSSAAKALLRTEQGITKLRGKSYIYSHPDIKYNISLVPTFHPAYLLRNPAKTEKMKVWEDMKRIKRELETKI